ncbi:hypothetical protein BDW74DRAFT_151757 [Aspergillus multicolor]|uniref:Zn(II)2Cys6 transcription factor domain-containing protein n=1 Tax=Aspergillus multicolor TaxID=41759 RepID=UPI003CCE1525
MSPPNASRTRASRNCANCRAVKRRCDQQRPHCGQCLRTREACPGYRDDWDLVFRDQTGHTIKRASVNRKTTNSPKTHATRGQVEKTANHFLQSLASASSSRSSLHHPPPSKTLGPSLDDIGVNYFLYEFVTGGRAPSRGYLNYIPPCYSDDASRPTLYTSMAAVGLMGLSSSQQSLMPHARTKYAQAIGLVNDALQCSVESIKDSTLMSVISLGVFEHVENFESWVRHVHGAAALVVARGKGQFTTRTALLMFNQVRADVTTACVQTVRPFPEELRVLQEEAARCDVDGLGLTSSACWQLGVLATRCATLFAGVAEQYQQRKARAHAAVHTAGSSPGIESAPWSRFLTEAIALQADFQAVLGRLSLEEPFHPTVLPASSLSGARAGRCDTYPSAWAIRLWNNARMVEIIVCEIACWLIDKVCACPSTTEDLDLGNVDTNRLAIKRRALLGVMAARGDDILATVPQGLGLLPPSPAVPACTPDYSGGPSVSGGYMLTWTLYAVAKSPVVSQQTRGWIIEQLEGISRSAGIAMALQLAREIPTGTVKIGA